MEEEHEKRSSFLSWLCGDGVAGCKVGALRGRVEGTNAELAFETADAGAVEALFHDVVDDYLAHCAEWGRRPARQYHGVFSVRMDAALHGRLVHWAKVHGMSLNAAMVRAAEELLKGQMETD